MMVDEDAAELDSEKGECWTDSSIDGNDGNNDNNDNDNNNNNIDYSSDKQSCNFQDDIEVSSNIKEAIDKGLEAVQTKHLEGLLKAIFGLSLSLCTQFLVDRQPSSTILVFASSIFGFSLGATSFLPACSYSSHLSSLIYIQHLLFLEYALLVQDYPMLRIVRRPHINQLERLKVIQKKHMILRAQSPLEEMLSLRAYVRVIARSDAPAFLFQ